MTTLWDTARVRAAQDSCASRARLSDVSAFRGTRSLLARSEQTTPRQPCARHGSNPRSRFPRCRTPGARVSEHHHHRGIRMRRLLPVLLLVVFGCQQATQQVQTAPPEPEPAPTAEPEAVIRMLAARRAERSGNTFRAVVEWQAACAADPTSLTIRFGLTKALMENGQTSHSLAEARSILDEDSTYVPVRSFLADYPPGAQRVR